ncbi:MAG: hypothetical protein HYT87_09060 [Nitrospirae bacterium]|nr:hypothetical protein [Nitrospirota bacterium]
MLEALIFAALAVSCGCTADTQSRPEGCRTLTVEDKPGADWACEDSKSCTGDYLAFPAIAAPYASPITEDELNRKLSDIPAGRTPIVAEPMPAETLREMLLDRLNMRFLEEGLDNRPLKVAITGETSSAEYEETALLFEDPLVGTFKGILLTPKTGGPSPGIVALHGHGDTAEIYRDTFHGNEYPAHGYAILMLTLRAMNIDADEHEVTRTLLLNGFNLISLRVYESLLGLRYIRCREDVDPDRVGLIGHSGGSSTGNLAVRIDPKLRAFVSDHQVDWYKSGDDEPYHCETAPDIYPYFELINDFPTSPTPILQVPYGYLFGMKPIWDFFKERLTRPPTSE